VRPNNLGGNGAAIGNFCLFCQDGSQLSLGLSGLHVNQKIGPLSTDVTVNIGFPDCFAPAAIDSIEPSLSLITHLIISEPENNQL
jgi:hypothetical protein